MKNIKILLFAFVASIFASSCLVDDDVAREFDESPAVVGFKSEAVEESYFTDEGTILKEYKILLLGNGGDGTLPTEDITITYEIDASSTATEGQEFDFVDTSGQFTIPAGSTYASFPLNVNTGSLDAEQPTVLTLNLTGTTSDNAVVSANNSSLDITFIGCESTLGATTYNNPDAGSNVTFTPDPNNPVSYTVSALPYLTSGGNSIPFELVDICGEIKINTMVLGSYPLIGEGVVNPDGSVTINFALYQGGEVLFDFRNDPSTYFPN